MKAIVIGVGDVGINVARTLSAEGHEVTAVDTLPARCESVRGELDALVVEGNGASPKLLREVGAGSADLLAAVTEVDEVNLIAALGARQLGVRTTIARVRDPEFFGGDRAFAHDVLGIDFVIDPDRATASAIAEAILLPGAVSVEYFGDGRLAVAEVIVAESSPLVGVELAQRERPHPAFIVGISRNGEARLIRPEMVPEPGDHLLVVAPREYAQAAVSHFGAPVHEVRDCVLFGGGSIGLRLAEVLQHAHLRVTLLERDEARARYVAERLPRVTVLHDEGVSRESLEAAGVDGADAFVSCAGDDRANLLAALNAKRLGAGLCVSVVSREEFTPLVDALEIDASYSPRLITAEAILRFVHTRTVRAIHLLRTGFEVIELEAQRDAPIVGRAVGDTRGLLRGWRVGAVLRGDEVIVPPEGVAILTGDRVLMLGPAGELSGIEAAFARGE